MLSMAAEKQREALAIVYGPNGEINWSGTLTDEEGQVNLTLRDGFCFLGFYEDGSGEEPTPADEALRNKLLKALQTQLGEENIVLETDGKIIHKNPPKSRIKMAAMAAEIATKLKDQTEGAARQVASSVRKRMERTAHAATQALKTPPDTALKAVLDPDGDGLVNYEAEITGVTYHVVDGVVFSADTDKLRKKITAVDALEQIALYLTVQYCQGKDFKVELKDGLVVLASRRKQRDETPELAFVKSGVHAFRDRLKKAIEPKVDKVAAKATSAARILELEKNGPMLDILDEVRTEVNNGSNLEQIETQLSKKTPPPDGNISQLCTLALEYLTLTGEIESEEAKRLRSERSKQREAEQTAEQKGLVRFIQSLRKKGRSDREIRVKLRENFGGTDEDEAAYDFAFRVAGERKRSGLLNRAKSWIPFAGERAWDKILIEEGLVRRIRKMRAEGKEDFEIEQALKEKLGDRARLDELVDYAFTQADSKPFHEKSALEFARTHGYIQQMRDALKSVQTDDENRRRIEDAEKFNLDLEIKKIGEGEGNDFAQEEINQIVAASFEGTVSGVETAKKWTTDRSKGIWGYLEAHRHKPGAWLGKTKKWVEDIDTENLKEWAKWGLLGTAVASVIPLALVSGTAYLTWQVIKRSPKVLWGGVRLGKNILKHTFTEGIPLVRSVAQTALNIGIIAPGRILSSPFVRAYQAFNWGKSYPSKPAKYQPKSTKWWNSWYKKPWQWTRNGVSALTHRGKQAALASAATGIFMLYGGLEGVGNALSKDVLGTNWSVPTLEFLEGTRRTSNASDAPTKNSRKQPRLS